MGGFGVPPWGVMWSRKLLAIWRGVFYSQVNIQMTAHETPHVPSLTRSSAGGHRYARAYPSQYACAARLSSEGRLGIGYRNAIDPRAVL